MYVGVYVNVGMYRYRYVCMYVSMYGFGFRDHRGCALGIRLFWNSRYIQGLGARV